MDRYERAEMFATHERLAGFFAPGSRLLECGSGSGRDAAFLLHKGMDIIALDSSPEMIAAARKRHPELKGRLLNGQIPEGLNGFSPESFDGLLSIATVMHLDPVQVRSFLEHAYKILRPAGRLYYSICLSRAGLNPAGFDDKGRYFLLREQEWWLNLTVKSGFNLADTMINRDGLGRREVLWLTIQAIKSTTIHLDS